MSNAIPPSCKNLPGISAAAALQIDTTNPLQEKCAIIGSFSSIDSIPELIKRSNPTVGISLTYLGDYCDNPVAQRKFIIQLTCSERITPIPTSVQETAHCTYTVQLPSIFGCPVECPVANRQLCGGNGHCLYDSDARASRCFCSSGTLFQNDSFVFFISF